MTYFENITEFSLLFYKHTCNHVYTKNNTKCTSTSISTYTILFNWL